MRSQQLFQQAQQLIPGGVSSPVRAFRGVGGDPLFIKQGQGAYVIDADGKKYIDYVGSWGPMIAGHANVYVMEKVIATMQRGFSFGAPTEIEIELANAIQRLMPSMEMLRFVSSGTEASMSAIRLARGYTKRNKIVKFSGCYHGHADSLLVAAGSGALTLGVPNSAGVPASIAAHTLIAPFNQLEQVADLFKQYGDDIACIIVEPVAGNMNCILPVPHFLQGLRDLCDQYQSILIFDEVITGFRVALGGAQAQYGIRPDLTILGKIIGGGFPVGAFGGRAEVMHSIAPLGPVYQAGTLSGNPVAMAAGLATLEIISAPHFHARLTAKTNSLIQGMIARAKAAHIPFYAHGVGGMFGFFFPDTDVTQILFEADVKQCHIERFKQFFHLMLQAGIYLAPSAFEAGFVSSAHTDEDIQKTLQAVEKVFVQLTADIIVPLTAMAR